MAGVPGWELAGAFGASGASAQGNLAVHARDGLGGVDRGICRVHDTVGAEHAARGFGVGVHSGAASATTESMLVSPNRWAAQRDRMAPKAGSISPM